MTAAPQHEVPPGAAEPRSKHGAEPAPGSAPPGSGWDLANTSGGASGAGGAPAGVGSGASPALRAAAGKPKKTPRTVPGFTGCNRFPPRLRTPRSRRDAPLPGARQPAGERRSSGGVGARGPPSPRTHGRARNTISPRPERPQRTPPHTQPEPPSRPAPYRAVAAGACRPAASPSCRPPRSAAASPPPPCPARRPCRGRGGPRSAGPGGDSAGAEMGPGTRRRGRGRRWGRGRAGGSSAVPAVPPPTKPASGSAAPPAPLLGAGRGLRGGAQRDPVPIPAGSPPPTELRREPCVGYLLPSPAPVPRTPASIAVSLGRGVLLTESPCAGRQRQPLSVPPGLGKCPRSPGGPTEGCLPCKKHPVL